MPLLQLAPPPVVMTELPLRDPLQLSLPNDGRLIADPLLTLGDTFSDFDALVDAPVTTTWVAPEWTDPPTPTMPPDTAHLLTVVNSPDSPRHIPDEESLRKSLTDVEAYGDTLAFTQVPLPDDDPSMSQFLSSIRSKAAERAAFKSALGHGDVSDHLSAIAPPQLPKGGHLSHDPLENLHEAISRLEKNKSGLPYSVGSHGADCHTGPVIPPGTDLSIETMIQAQIMQAKFAEAMRSFMHAMEHGNVSVNLVGTPAPLVPLGPFDPHELMCSTVL